MGMINWLCITITAILSVIAVHAAQQAGSCSEAILAGGSNMGKSTVANTVAAYCHSSERVETGAGASSHTQHMTRIVLNTPFGDVCLSDGPGLMDSAGEGKDEKNIRIIVDHARSLGHLHAMLLVLNEAVPRFDKAMQDIVKLLVDSMGEQVLGVMGIVYTHACGFKTHAEAESKTAEIAAMIAECLNLSAPLRLPFWQLECVPQRSREDWCLQPMASRLSSASRTRRSRIFCGGARRARPSRRWTNRLFLRFGGRWE